MTGFVDVILVLVVIGFVLWLINRYVPMQAGIKNLLNIVVVIIAVLWILGLLGVGRGIIPAVHILGR